MSLPWIILGAAALWALIRLGRQFEKPGHGGWRVTAVILAAAAMGGAGLSALRGGWLLSVVLAGAGLWLAFSARQRPAASGRKAMSEAEALAILGLKAGADEAAVRASWRRLMARAHPDVGGTEGLAERLNAARDRLLRR